MSWSLILFDCDGVLIDSERYSVRILSETLSRIGLNLSADDCLRLFMGKSVKSCTEIIEQSLGRDIPPDYWDMFHRELHSTLEANLRAVPGIAEVLQSLPWKCCVASSNDHAAIRKHLIKTGLYQHFKQNVFSALEVKRGKPHPDLFLYAAEKMNADPTKCAVIEDSVYGIQAAHAAGMKPFAFVGGIAPRSYYEDSGATIFSNMSELLGLLTDSSLSHQSELHSV